MRFFYLKRRFWVTVFLGFLLLGWVIKKAHVGEILTILKNTNPLWLSGAVFCSVGSYVCIGEIMQTLVQAVRRNLSRTSAYLIAFISTVVNYVVSVGGISGLTVKVYLLSRKKIPAGETLSISVVHGFFTNTVAVFIVLLGIIFTVKRGFLDNDFIALPVFLVITATLLIGLLGVAFVVSKRIRELCWLVLRKIIPGRSNQDKIKRFLSKVEGTFRCFHESIMILTKSTKRLALTALYAVADWVLMFGCLYSSFLSVHYNVKLQVLIIGFCMGLLVSLVSVVPAGIGVYEGSMVGVFYLMGLDYERSLAAVMIYRLIYFIIPALLGLLLLGKELVDD